MNNDDWGKVWTERAAYVENRCKFPRQELRKYAGQWIAWSADGSRVVAHHADLQQVVRLVEEAGIRRMDVVFDHEPMEDVDTIL